MLQRIITGAIIAVLMIVVVVFSGTWIFPVVMTLLTALGTYEMLCCVGTNNKLLISIPTILSSVLSAVCAYFFGYGTCLAIIMLYLTVLLAMCVFFDEKIKVNDVFCTFTSALYVMLCFAAFTTIRKIDGIGLYMFLLVFIAAWITDTFAYFTGIFIGKHKLIPRISPKKTIEGSIGGIVFCVIAFSVYGIVLNKCFDVDVNFPVLLAVGFVMSIISQIGDLIASAIKRSYGIKDYSNLFPGHGGILDRFDSIMILSPFLLFAAENLRIFG
ncbi:MAG: phosphatidate cytidylyltransferase [Clostridia bacterium]|nr:phosphatidate cytidylyltransferase [Clostridia bacterium]